MRSILWSFKNSIFMNVIKLLHLLVAIVVLFISYGFLNDIYIKYVDSKNMFNDEAYIIDKSNYSFREFRIPNYLKDNYTEEGIRKIGNYSVEKELGMNYIRVDRQFYEFLNISLSDGQGFNMESFKENENREIIITEDIASDFKINEEKNITVNGEILDVVPVGIITEKMKLWVNSTFLTEVPKKTIIIPVVNDDDKLKTNTYFYIDRNESVERFKVKNDINFIINYNDGLDKYVEGKKEDIFYTIFLSTSLFIVLVIGLITLFGISTRNRFKEIGIKFLTGYTKKSICFEIMLEEFILLNIAVSIVTLIVLYINPRYLLSLGININLNVLVLVYITMTLILIIATGVASNIIKRVQPNNLIRGVK